MAYARLTDDGLAIIEICPHATPEGFYTPNVAAQFVPVPDGVEAGWQLVDGTWTAPVPVPTPAPPPAPVPTTVNMPAVLWYNCWTPAEAIGIKTSADPVIQEFWFRLNLLIQAGHDIDTSTPSVQAGVHYIASKGITTPERVAQILLGKLQ